MGDKRLKIAKGFGNMIPMTINFSELEELIGHRQTGSDTDGDIFIPSDDGLEQERLLNKVDYEEILVQLLCNLEMREKLVLLFQVLRDCGYQIDHTAFAKSIGLSRRWYMKVLEDVRMKSALFIIGYRQSAK